MTASSFTRIQISPEMQALLRRWINFHRVLWLLTFTSFFIAWNRGLALLYGLFSLLAALLLLSYVMPRWQLRNIHTARGVVGNFTVGEKAGIPYFLETGSTRYHVELSESLSFTGEQACHHFFHKLSKQTSCQLEFICRYRGCYRLQDIRLACAYPFGIVKYSRAVSLEPVEILVFPRVVTLSGIPMPIVADASTLGDAVIAQNGGRDEFAGVREYCRGDAMNRIHWPVSARYGDLVVRTYDQTERPALLVVLDCREVFNVGQGNRSTFEHAVTLAASMIRFASGKGMRSFMVTRQGIFRELTIEAYCPDFYTLYADLARLKSHGRHPYHLLVEQAHRRFPRACLVATFRLDTDMKRPRLSAYVTHIDMVMDKESFYTEGQERGQGGIRREGKRWICRVGADADLENVFS